jgi:hypothetical protein
MSNENLKNQPKKQSEKQVRHSEPKHEVEPRVVCQCCVKKFGELHRFYSLDDNGIPYTVVIPPEAYKKLVVDFGLSRYDLDGLIGFAWAALTNANPMDDNGLLPKMLVEWPWHARLADDLDDLMKDVVKNGDLEEALAEMRANSESNVIPITRGRSLSESSNSRAPRTRAEE